MTDEQKKYKSGANPESPVNLPVSGKKPPTALVPSVSELLVPKEMKRASFLSRTPEWLALLIGFSATAAVTFLLNGVLRQDRLSSLQRSAIEIQNRLEERFRLYEFSLLQIQAFAHAKKSVVERGDLSEFEESFATYVAGLDITTLYPGSRGVGLLEKVEPAEREAHLKRRRDRMGALYRIWPDGNPGTAYPMIRFEPPNSSLTPSIYGVDHATDPIRATALATAFVTGKVAASEPTRFLADPSKTEESKRPWGFFLYAPLFSGKNTNSVADRHRALLGYVFSSFRFDYLISRAVPPPLPATIQRIQLVSELDRALVYYDSEPDRKTPPDDRVFDYDLGLPGLKQAFFLRVFPAPIPIFNHLNLIPLLVALVGSLLTIALWRELRARHRLSAALEEGIELRTRQLFRLLDEQKHTNAHLKLLNDDLESFGYSVSHDLRAPLRGIDSFGALLEDEYRTTLGDAGKKYVEFMRQGAQKAARILDDLLRLSRLSRTEPKLVRVDLAKEAGEMIEALRLSSPDRHVTFEAVGVLEAFGDEGLIRIALENLLSNAWKFTRDRPDARILLRGEFSGEDEVSFEVIDNGAGFPAEHASQLFGVFRRLHSEKEFPGTGVGLATVKRVILKHGGRVWAENRIEGGAVFGFSLPSHPGRLYGKSSYVP